MAVGMGDQFCLRWNNYHYNMTSVINQLLAEEAFVDVTLACDGARIKAHRVVLSACSPYFQRVLLDNPCKHPVLILPIGVGHADLRAIVEFIYRGETYVTRDQLSSIVRVAELLKIKGLCEVSQQQNEPPPANALPMSLSLPPMPQHTQGLGPVSGTIAVAYGTPAVMDPNGVAVGPSQVMSLPQQQQQQQQQQLPQQPQLQQTNPSLPPVTNSQGMTSNAATQANSGIGTNPGTGGQGSAPLGRPPYSTTYRGRPRGRKTGATSPSKGWTGNQGLGGEKRSAGQAGISSGNAGSRKQSRGSFRGSWQGRSPNKTNANMAGTSDGTGVGEDLMDQTGVNPLPQQGGPATQDVGGYHSNLGSSTPNSGGNLDAQAQSAIYGDSRDYTAQGLDHMGGHATWSHLGQHPSHTFTPSPSTSSNQDRSFKTEPEHGNSEFTHPNSRPPSETVGAVSNVENERNGHEEGSDLTVTPEILGLMPSHIPMHQSGQGHPHHMQQHHSGVQPQHTHHQGNNGGTPEAQPSNNGEGSVPGQGETPSKKLYTPEAMEAALEALRTGSMSLTKAAVLYGIPSTTLWQRAHRLGIDTPMRKDPANRNWSEDDLRLALDALRAGKISANRASKEYGIPSSTLYKIARKEGIKLAAPFNASPTSWSPEDLGRALEAIKNGMSVQRAATQYSIPSGTLYGRCKREGIELVHKNYSGDKPWSDTNMTDAMESVRQREMSINQAAIHFNVPYSSLYNRIKRSKTSEESGDGFEHALSDAPPPVPDEGDVYEGDMDNDDALMMAGAADHHGGGGQLPPGAVVASPGHPHSHPHVSMTGEPAPSPYMTHPSFLSGHVPSHVALSLPLPVPLAMDYQTYAAAANASTNAQSSGAAYQQ